MSGIDDATPEEWDRAAERARLEADNGFKDVPHYYRGRDGKEAWDEMVETMLAEGYGIEGVIAGCRLIELKYGRRQGKADPTEESRKALWYRMMRMHLKYPALFPDPRAYRGPDAGRSGE